MDTSPLGTQPLWGFTSLPPLFRGLAREIAVSRGKSAAEADGEDIASAVRTAKRWAAGERQVSLRTRARAADAVAEWDRKKAQAAARRAGKGT